MMAQPTCLVADIGGTNTRMAISDGLILRDDSIKRFKNAEHETFYTIIDLYLSQMGLTQVDRAAVAVAGPVTGGRAEMTNLDWVFEGKKIAEKTGATHVGLLNDLQAQGHSLHLLRGDDIQTLMHGNHAPSPTDTKIVIGMGTGFNAAPVYHTKTGTHVPPAEIGHARIAVAGATQARIVDAIAQVEGFVSNEHILAGRGLERIDAILNNRHDRSAADIMTAASAGDSTAVSVAETQAQFAGSVYGDMALANLPLGGLYLIGGVARALSPYLSQPIFADAFCDKGRFATFNKQFSVYVILDDFAALKGCASFVTSLA